MKRTLFVVLPVLVVAVLIVGLGQSSRTTASAQQKASAQPPWERGDAYLYRRFFALVLDVGRQADDADAQGMNSSYLRNFFQTTAKLNNSQVFLLSAVAADLDVQLRRYQARAAELQQERHIEVQKKRLSHEPIPAPPLELVSLREGRDALVLQARDRLRHALGDPAFQQLDTYVRAEQARQQANGGQPPPAQNNSAALPDAIAYRAFFRSLAGLKARAEQERSWGLPETAASMETFVQRAAAISAEQAAAVDRIAAEYRRKYAALDQQVAKAFSAYKRASLDMLARDGKITQTAGLAAAAAPFNEVRAQMDTLTLGAVQQLRAALGDADFARFDAFVKQAKKIAPAHSTGTPAAAKPEVSQ